MGTDDGLAVWVGRADGATARTTWIDDVRVSSGFLLDTGAVAFGVTLNNGSDVSPLAPPAGYTYTADPAVFSFSPTTGPTDGNTTVVLKGSMLAGGSDYRCRFGAEGTTVAATYEPDEEELTVCPPRVDAGLLPGSDRGAAVVALEVSLNNRYYSSTGAMALLPTARRGRRPRARPVRPPPPAPAPSISSPRLTPSLPRRSYASPAGVGAQLSSSVPTSAAETTTSRASSRRPR